MFHKHYLSFQTASEFGFEVQLSTTYNQTEDFLVTLFLTYYERTEG